ncbi:cytochrome P450 [Trametes elegans]|nr:cytochrome P450 [Trametes elegans]
MILLLAAVLAFGWVLWRFLRPSSAFKKVLGPPPKSWISGHVKELSARDAFGFMRMLETVYGTVTRVKGPFGQDWLYLYDPKAVYSILSKDQGAYDELEWFMVANNFYLGPGLLGIRGDTHRKQRKMLHPVFSVRHIREVTPIFYRVAHKLLDAISHRVADGPRDLDLLGWMGRTALELVSQAGIGYSLDPLTEDKTEDELAVAVKSPLFFAPESMIYHQIVTFLKKCGLPSVARFIVNNSPNRTIQDLRAAAHVLHAKSIDIVQRRKAALERGEHTGGKDIMTVLLKANTAATVQDQLPDDQLTSQVSTLLFAATDTTSNVLSRILHTLCERPDLQTKLRQEIVAARDGDDLTFEGLHALPFLDAVCKETLRCFTPAPTAHRLAYQDVVLPFSQPIRATDGSHLDSILVPKGSVMVISTSACNRNKALWGEDADEFKPERWLGGLPRAVEETPIPGVYSNLMSFLGGGRACIGFQFALLEMKVVLSLLLSHFTFELSKDKPVYWNHSGVIYPSLEKDSDQPQMWLRVSKHMGEAAS